MGYELRPARKSEAKPLIGLYAESGCGKTLSALYLALGYAGSGQNIVMIETESGRGEAFSGSQEFPDQYRVISMRGDFSPTEYGKAIAAAEAAKPQALIIDSASHEWEGAGGVLSMAADNQAAGKKGVLVWQQPKMDHQRHFMLRLMQTPIPLVIVCMRAKYPMLEIKKDGKKEWVRSEVLEPKQSDDILFEMFVHGWIDREHRFHGTKYTVGDLRHVLRDGEPISVQSGERLRAWAAGDKAQPAGETITPEQAENIQRLCQERAVPIARVLHKGGIENLANLPASKYRAVVDWLSAKAATSMAPEASQAAAPSPQPPAGMEAAPAASTTQNGQTVDSLIAAAKAANDEDALEEVRTLRDMHITDDEDRRAVTSAISARFRELTDAEK